MEHVMETGLMLSCEAVAAELFKEYRTVRHWVSDALDGDSTHAQAAFASAEMLMQIAKTAPDEVRHRPWFVEVMMEARGIWATACRIKSSGSDAEWDDPLIRTKCEEISALYLELARGIVDYGVGIEYPRTRIRLWESGRDASDERGV
jgi:hypothetical protein